MKVQGAPPEHFPWLLERIGLQPTAHFRAIEAVDARGVIQGMVGFDAWTESSAQMHVAIANPLAVKHLIAPAFHFIFEQEGRIKAIGLVPADNLQALRFDLHLGFRETYRIKDGADVGEDLVLLEMYRTECRWLRRRERKAA